MAELTKHLGTVAVDDWIEKVLLAGASRGETVPVPGVGRFFVHFEPGIGVFWDEDRVAFVPATASLRFSNDRATPPTPDDPVATLLGELVRQTLDIGPRAGAVHLGSHARFDLLPGRPAVHHPVTGEPLPEKPASIVFRPSPGLTDRFRSVVTVPPDPRTPPDWARVRPAEGWPSLGAGTPDMDALADRWIIHLAGLLGKLVDGSGRRLVIPKSARKLADRAGALHERVDALAWSAVIGEISLRPEVGTLLLETSAALDTTRMALEDDPELDFWLDELGDVICLAAGILEAGRSIHSLDERRRQLAEVAAARR